MAAVKETCISKVNTGKQQRSARVLLTTELVHKIAAPKINAMEVKGMFSVGRSV